MDGYISEIGQQMIFYVLKFSDRFAEMQQTEHSAALFLLKQNAPTGSALPSPDVATLVGASESDIDHFESELGVPRCNSNSG